MVAWCQRRPSGWPPRFSGDRVSTLGQTLTTLRGGPGRTFLTALGTALGIATIVALLAVVGGVKHSAGNLVNLGPSELGLFQADAADPTTSILSTTLIPSSIGHRESPPRRR